LYVIFIIFLFFLTRVYINIPSHPSQLVYNLYFIRLPAVTGKGILPVTARHSPSQTLAYL